jgi:hypothetical protein
LSADDELELPPFNIIKTLPSLPSGSENPIKDLLADLYVQNNVNYSGGATTVKGIGNTIGQNVRGFVVGDNQTIEETGYWVNGKNIGDVSDFYEAIDYFSIEIDYDLMIDPLVQSVIYLTAPGLNITIPSAALYNDKKIYIKNISSGSCLLISDRLTIDDEVTKGLDPLESLTLHASGDIWNIL